MAIRPAVLFALVALTVSCRPGGSSPGAPPEIPGPEEVRTFLSRVGEAAAAADESALRGFFEGGASYPDEDFAMLRSSQFWLLRPARRVKRLGPDAFQIDFLPEQPPAREGPVTMSVRVTVPVRRGKDGQFRVLARKEAERLAKVPVPEDPEGEVVALDYPDEGGLGRTAGTHYATEMWAEARGQDVGLSFRFDPPLTAPGLSADRPVKDRFHSGEEIQLEIWFDADASAATGFRMDELYRRMQELEKGAYPHRAQEIQRWQGLGVEKRLALDGKKFVQADGVRAWAMRATLRDVAPEIVQEGMLSLGGDVVYEKTLADPEIAIEDDVFTLTVPAALLPMTAGGAYRVMLQNNGGSGVLLKPRKGIVRAAAGPSSSKRGEP